ncbi:MAG: hypothetical protein AABX34_02690 [Nanoarchaeota archaeon]
MTALEKSLLNVHDTIVNALEEDVYREYIGRFHVERATGLFENRATEERRVQLADKIKDYKLHLKLGDEEIPGINEKPESFISFEHEKWHTSEHKVVCAFKIRADFPVRDNVPHGPDQKIEIGRWDINNDKVGNYSHPWDKNIRVTDETLDWIYDQLMTYRNPAADEKAKQLAGLLSCGDELEGKFHYAALGGAEQKELPDIAVPHEGEWRIERIDRPHRGRLFILTASKVAPDYTLMVSYSSVDNVFDGHEFRPGEEKQPRTFSKTENPYLLDKALDAIARRIGYNWK